eukprot:m.258912 g.258912  ORF g.258912 m.258912 type:complete len:68 (+) comp22067_c0_seq1:86-289(+)
MQTTGLVRVVLVRVDAPIMIHIRFRLCLPETLSLQLCMGADHPHLVQHDCPDITSMVLKKLIPRRRR